MLADSDDILEPDCVLKKVKYLENHPDKGLVSAKARIVDERNLKTTLGYSYNKSTNWCEDVVFTNKAVCTCGIYMLRSENFLQIYPQRHIFDSRAGQNYQILVPMSYYFKYGQIDDIVYNYVVRQNSLSHQKINIKDTYNRFDEFIKILENTTKCLPENYRKSYMKKVYEHFAVQKLHSSLKQNDVNITKAALENLKIPEKSYFESLVGNDGAVVTNAQELLAAVNAGKETICVYGKIDIEEQVVYLKANQKLVGIGYYGKFDSDTNKFSALNFDYTRNVGRSFVNVLNGSNVISDLEINVQSAGLADCNAIYVNNTKDILIKNI